MNGTSPTTVTLPAPAATSAPAAGRRIERWGWGAVGAITAVVASTWVARLGEPFGDNHLGRIVGRYALHERNLREQGILGSHFGADWAPYASTPYAHHPPLLNFLTALTGLLPGEAEYQVWLPPYLLALLIIPAGAALLRGFAVRWSATLLAVGLMVATPFYWVYSPLMFDLAPILALSAAVVRLRTRPDPGRALVAGACAAALSTTLVSWPGIAFAAALGLVLFLARRIDRVTILVAASMLTGLAISLAFMVGVSGMTLLGGQAELRSTGGDHTMSQFLDRQWHFAYLLLPVWYLGALPLGAVAGLLDRRTRSYLATAIGFTAVWVLGLSNGSYVHSYWSYPVLVVGLVGMGVLLDRIVGRLVDRPTPDPATGTGTDRARRGSRALSRLVGRRSVRLVAVALVWAALGTYLGAGLVVGPVRNRLLTEPTQAGRLVAEHPPPAGQRYAWIAGTSVTTPRWLVYYWRLAPRSLTAERLRSDPTARPEDLVLMNVRQRPDWLPESVEALAVDRDGPYALFPVATLRAAARY